MDTQDLLIIVVALLTVNLLFVGAYIVLVLKEVRESFQKINAMLETASQVTAAVGAPIITAAGTLNAFVGGFSILQTVKDLRRKKAGQKGKGVEDG